MAAIARKQPPGGIKPAAAIDQGSRIGHVVTSTELNQVHQRGKHELLDDAQRDDPDKHDKQR